MQSEAENEKIDMVLMLNGIRAPIIKKDLGTVCRHRCHDSKADDVMAYVPGNACDPSNDTGSVKVPVIEQRSLEHATLSVLGGDILVGDPFQVTWMEFGVGVASSNDKVGRVKVVRISTLDMSHGCPDATVGIGTFTW